MDCLGYFIQRVFIATGVRLNMSLSNLSMRGDYYPALRIYFSLAGRVPVSGDPHAPV